MRKPLWEPDAARCAASNLTRFLNVLAPRAVRSSDDLHRYSVEEPESFWAELWDFAGVKGDKGERPWLVDAERMPGARFFPHGRLNYAENALSRRGPDSALIFWGEDKVKTHMSWDELRDNVGRFQSFLADARIGSDDRVAAMLPNMPESVVGLLGTAATGAVWSSCSPDFGVQGVIDRFGQIEPKVLIACDGYYYSGKEIDLADKLAAILPRLPSVEHVLIVSYLGRAEASVAHLKAVSGSNGQKIATWRDEVSARPACEPAFARLPFAHPIYILFSSGTTGTPKCIVHSVGGVLLKHMSEQILHSDVKPGDRLFYFTTLGWMMWNWLVSGLAAGATLLLYDGSPFYPDGNILWDYAAAGGVTHFGTSAKYIDTLRKHDLKLAATHDLSALRVLMSTGSPLAPESYDYVYRRIKRDLHLASISGGTDICGCFVLGNPLRPVWRGEIQSPALGLAVDVVDDDGQSLAGGKGELVCRNAFPSMPVGFWNDPIARAYKQAYFARFPGIWHHGDFAEWTEHGGMIIHGRSDATLNPQGVRIGTAEIYRQVEQLPEIVESIVIGQEVAGDVRVVLFVVLKQGVTLDDALRERIKRQIREGASPRHVPSRIIAVADIPRTKSGKITELAVRDVIMGREVKNKEALANPEALELFRGLEELRN